ncbi:PREDICTED: putative calcium-activated potassium channel subunit beta [Thamnophis sirtalis]|uniref:Calcium-activated potassium channel subunit beta n=1 Tax=Thamnophis sirtalis TaxID=35019 RepID=A0A6I9Z4L5_9SAUR|nr:PREDICTED: putative calcium-activated potassium channel subunit beta [Thamnophis sirtalis]XP_013932043.1 PREDICTED: putative calcium-activated potassium channel subunit beta [Thamnophis sirtalis]XP_013932044.1 PREDICTED: putative calcium-activated potassium channel subunit beta [Thamnophis sirtalis]XP_013932045.1 PREDICTED: putative calcium-activated potassium channel subunit beta [Thamnophis sirtalis]
MLRKKLVAAQKRGETRALWLGLGMMACSAMMYLFIGIVLVYLHRRSVWADKSECDVVKANIKEDQCSSIEGSEDKYIFHYPCLEVYVNLTHLGQVVMLYYTEQTVERNPKCSYIPLVMGNYEQVQQQVEEARDYFRMNQRIPCHYDPSGEEKSVLFKRLYPPEGFLIAFACPSMLLIGGILIVILVKLNQYLALVSARQRRTVM